MWLISKYGFVSVVANKDDGDSVLIRARSREDIEELCTLADDSEIPWLGMDSIQEDPNADYRYRLTVPSKSWAKVAEQIASLIDYPNFKSEISKMDRERAELYGQVWADLMKIQYPDMEDWSDKTEADRREMVARLYRMTAEHLSSCLAEYTQGAPISEESIGDALDPPILAEQVDGDPARILELRLIQRVGMGFFQREEGDGFERLRAAIKAAEQAAAMQLADGDCVPEGD
jgi:hypothetical protein